MIDTLIKIGSGKVINNFWDDILEYPRITPNKSNFILNIIFDIDNLKTIISNENLSSYDVNNNDNNFDSVYIHKNIKIKGRHNKAHYVCTHFKKIKQLSKSFFGNDDGNLKFLDFFSLSNYHDLINSDFYNALKKIYEAKEKLFFNENDIAENIILNNNESLILCYISIKSKELNNSTESIEISKLNGYDDFMNLYYNKEDIQDEFALTEKLDYATGKLSSKVNASVFSGVNNLNKIFVTTTINYANDFCSKNFNRNYQISTNTVKELDRGANYLNNNLKVKIAGIDHLIIPAFPSFNNADIDLLNTKVKIKSDILFNLKTLQELAQYLEDEFDFDFYWLNYFAYETNGAYFKIINHIKDINNFYINDILKILSETSYEMNNIIELRNFFNFYSIYCLIPVRNNKGIKNVALEFLDNILIRREIQADSVYTFFKELILCHRYSRYKSFTNIKNYDNFDFAIKDSVFQYFIIFQILKKLKLINTKIMGTENNISQNVDTDLVSDNSKELSVGEKIQLELEKFFQKMGYNNSQKSLFFLGRVLNQIAYAQEQKGHSKPVLNKLNYNGLNKNDILKLRNDLSEKAKQYNKVNETDFNFKEFTRLFNFNNWEMHPDEALFFILSGYSFGFIKKNNN